MPTTLLGTNWHSSRLKERNAGHVCPSTTAYARLKTFNCLLARFHDGVTKHGLCFRAVAVLTQLAIESGEPLMDMREYDDRLTDREVSQIFGV